MKKRTHKTAADIEAAFVAAAAAAGEQSPALGALAYLVGYLGMSDSEPVRTALSRITDAQCEAERRDRGVVLRVCAHRQPQEGTHAR